MTLMKSSSRVGKLRLQLPQPIARHTGVINATAFGNQCIQQTIIPPTIPSNLPPEIAPFVGAMAEPLAVPQSEDCLCIYTVAIVLLTDVSCRPEHQRHRASWNPARR